MAPLPVSEPGDVIGAGRTVGTELPGSVVTTPLERVVGTGGTDIAVVRSDNGKGSDGDAETCERMDWRTSVGTGPVTDIGRLAPWTID